MYQLSGSADRLTFYEATVQVQEQSGLTGKPLVKRADGSIFLLTMNRSATR
jgi:hypothetical protein